MTRESKVGYKVVRRQRDGLRLSVLADESQGAVIYLPDIWVGRPLRRGRLGGPVAVFQSLDDARAWVDTVSAKIFFRHTPAALEIWRCLYAPSRLVTLWFWDDNLRRRYTRSAQFPPGTATADKVRLLELVYTTGQRQQQTGGGNR